MNIKGLTAELDMRDEAVDLQEEPKENEGNVATAVKETIDVTLEMDGESIRNSDVAIPFKQRQRKKHLADPENSEAEFMQRIAESERATVSVRDPQEQKVILPFEKKGEYFVEPLGEIAHKTTYNVIKRIFDIFASSIGLIVLVIPMAIIAVMIKIKSPGPIFYHQERLGLRGKKIDIVKFRTMNVDAETAGAQWSQGEDDPRIFPFGKILRKARLDELPQLVAVFTGKMSLVGPRPERACFYSEFETYVHGFHERLKVKPGITGLAQVNGGYDLKPEEKILWDVEYIKKRNLWLDLKILFKTVAVVFNHNGAK